MPTADEHKQRGNEAYQGGNYQSAVEWYSKAIEADDRNAIYYNNRAAAYMELGKYEEAAKDAERSAILSPTPKANGRHGRALWQLGKTADAIAAYERALRLQPGNTEYADALLQLKGKKERATAPEGARPPERAASSVSGTALRLDIAIALCAMAYLPLILLAPALSHRAWQSALTFMAIRQLIAIGSSAQQGEMRTFAFWKSFATSKATTTFPGQYLLLCVALLLAGAPGQQFLLVAIGIYAAVDACTTQRPQLQGGFLERRLGGRLDQVRSNAQQLFLQAGACEALSLFMLPVSGCPLIGMVVVCQFVKWRYSSDRWSQQAWAGLRQQVSQFAHHPRCPALVGTLFDKMAALLRRAAG